MIIFFFSFTCKSNINAWPYNLSSKTYTFFVFLINKKVIFKISNATVFKQKSRWKRTSVRQGNHWRGRWSKQNDQIQLLGRRSSQGVQELQVHCSSNSQGRRGQPSEMDHRIWEGKRGHSSSRCLPGTYAEDDQRHWWSSCRGIAPWFYPCIYTVYTLWNICIYDGFYVQRSLPELWFLHV